VKEALESAALIFSDLHLPTEKEFKYLEELVAALRPIEILTSKLCRPNFNVLQVFRPSGILFQIPLDPDQHSYCDPDPGVII